VILEHADYIEARILAREAADLMTRYHEYAKSIGCVTYEEGPLCDAIECDEAQGHLLHEWWKAHT
jgi:hypothetical protein